MKKAVKGSKGEPGRGARASQEEPGIARNGSGQEGQGRARKSHDEPEV